MAIALLFMAEEDAFWCLVYIIEHLMPAEYYSRDKQLIGAQVDQVFNVHHFFSSSLCSVHSAPKGDKSDNSKMNLKLKQPEFLSHSAAKLSNPLGFALALCKVAFLAYALHCD